MTNHLRAQDSLIGTGLLPYPTSDAIRMPRVHRGCINLMAQSCQIFQISPNRVNQIDGAEVWATQVSSLTLLGGLVRKMSCPRSITSVESMIDLLSYKYHS